METNFRLYLLNLPSFAPKNLLREFFKGADHDGHSVVEQSRPKQKGVPCELSVMDFFSLDLSLILKFASSHITFTILMMQLESSV